MSDQGEEKMRSFSAVILVILFGLAIAQFFPLTGIFLMFLGAPIWSGALVHVLFLAITIEAVVRVIPRTCLIFPVIFYGGYYFSYFKQSADMSAQETRLKSENKLLPVAFDPKRQALFVPNTGAFVTKYRVPVAYNTENDVMSYRLAGPADCLLINGLHVSKAQAMWSLDQRLRGAGARRTNVCAVRTPSSTDLERVEAKVFDPVQVIRSQSRGIAWSSKNSRSRRDKCKDHYFRACGGEIKKVPGNAGNQKVPAKPLYDPNAVAAGHIDIVVGGHLVSQFSTAAVNKLSAFPYFYFGCALNDGAASWDCFYGFRRSMQVLNTMPDGEMVEDTNDIIGLMLGVKKYSVEELETLRSAPSNVALVDEIKAIQAYENRTAADELNDMLAGKDIKPSINFAYNLSKDITFALEKNADRIVDRLQVLVAPTPTGKGTDRKFNDDQVYALSGALVALYDNDFQKRVGKIFKIVKSGNPHLVPALYVRAGDAGKPAANFYIQDFANASSPNANLEGFPTYAVLAICRLKEYGKPAVERLKKAYLSLDVISSGTEKYRQALTLTLLQLEQKPFLLENLNKGSILDRKWIGKMLSGAPMSAIGPNNCMMKDWPYTDPLPESMKPTVTK